MKNKNICTYLLLNTEVLKKIVWKYAEGLLYMKSRKEKPVCNLYTVVPSGFKFRFQRVLVLHSIDLLEHK